MYNPKVFDKEYLRANLACLKNEIEDLETWSVHNNDVALDRIQELREDFLSVYSVLIGKKAI